MKLERYDGEVPIFSEDYEGRERTIFGSVTESNDINDQFTPEFMRGWGIVGDTEFPTLQDFNALGFTHGKLISYLYQAGIPSYTANEKYYAGSIVQYNNDIYLCTATEPTSFPTDVRDWVKWQSSLGELAQIRADKNGFLLNKAGTYNALIDTDLVQARGQSATRIMSQLAVTTELNTKANTTYVDTELGKKRDLSNSVFERENFSNIVLRSIGYQGTGKNIFLENHNGNLSVIRREGMDAEGNQTIVSFQNKTGTTAHTSDLIGVGQSWQNVKGSRAAGSTYTNNTGKSISISIGCLTSQDGYPPNILCDGVVVSYGVAFKSSTIQNGVNALIPPGSVYSLMGDISDIVFWSELR